MRVLSFARGQCELKICVHIKNLSIWAFSIAFTRILWYNEKKNRSSKMTISYKKLWKLLIDKDMKKKDLQLKAQISPASIAKLSKNENVTTEVLLKICRALNCDVSDIMETTEEIRDE